MYILEVIYELEVHGSSVTDVLSVTVLYIFFCAKLSVVIFRYFKFSI